MVDTKGLKRTDVLKVLYNRSHTQGLGFLQAVDGPLSEREARCLLEKMKYFDYLHGKIMKVDLSDPDGFEESGYDRDNYPGAAQDAINFFERTN